MPNLSDASDSHELSNEKFPHRISTGELRQMRTNEVVEKWQQEATHRPSSDLDDVGSSRELCDNAETCGQPMIDHKFSFIHRLCGVLPWSATLDTQSCTSI
jgi:hypothetical protein